MIKPTSLRVESIGATRLVLTRKPGEAIQIGGDIIITIINLRHGQARIAIDAPREIAVWRTELLDRDDHERRGA